MGYDARSGATRMMKIPEYMGNLSYWLITGACSIIVGVCFFAISLKPLALLLIIPAQLMQIANDLLRRK